MFSILVIIFFNIINIILGLYCDHVYLNSISLSYVIKNGGQPG